MGAIATTLTNLQAFPNLNRVATVLNNIPFVNYSNLQSLHRIVKEYDGTVSINADNCNSLEEIYMSGSPDLILENCIIPDNLNLLVLFNSDLTNSSINYINDNLINLQVLVAAENQTLTEVNVSNLTSLEELVVFDCEALETIILPNSNQLIAVFAGNAALLDVNQILIDLDNNSLSDGVVVLTEGTSVAPSGAGITAKNNLIAKGWGVATN
jgi:hypothetical protein